MNKLYDNLNNDDPKIVIAAAKEIGLSIDAIGLNHLLKLLRDTENGAVRNAVALILSDMKEPRAFSVICDLLKDDRTMKNRGTLLYAIGENYDCSPIFPLLIDFVIEGNFEVSREAFNIIAGTSIFIESESWANHQKKLKVAYSIASEERRSLIAELLSLFEQSELEE